MLVRLLRALRAKDRVQVAVSRWHQDGVRVLGELGDVGERVLEGGISLTVEFLGHADHETGIEFAATVVAGFELAVELREC